MLRKRAQRPGQCAACQKPYAKGERVVFREAVHEKCHLGAFAAVPAAQSVEQIRLTALAALEDALETMAAQNPNGLSQELAKQLEKYEKFKALALRPGTDAEGLAFMQRTLIEAVKMVFA